MALLVVGVIATIVVFSAVLVPVIDDTTRTTKTFVNTGVPFAEVDADTHTIVMDATGMTTDGEKVEGFEFLYGNSVSILYCESNVVRWSTNGEVQVIGNTNASGQRRVVGDTDTDTLTFTITNGVVAVANSNAEGVITLGSNALAYPTADESAKYRQGTQHYYTEDTDLIIAGGFSNTTEGGQVALVMTGTVDNLTADYVWYYSVAATVADIDVQTSNVCTDLNQVDKILVTMDITATGDDYYLTYTQFLSEATGTYTNPNYPGSTLSSMLGIIPIIAIMGIVLAVVAVAIVGRNDY